MNLALDTNRYVDLCKGVEPTVQLVATADRIAVPFVVVGELHDGNLHGRRTRTLRGVATTTQPAQLAASADRNQLVTSSHSRH